MMAKRRPKVTTSPTSITRAIVAGCVTMIAPWNRSARTKFSTRKHHACLTYYITGVATQCHSRATQRPVAMPMRTQMRLVIMVAAIVMATSKSARAQCVRRVKHACDWVHTRKWPSQNPNTHAPHAAIRSIQNTTTTTVIATINCRLRVHTLLRTKMQQATVYSDKPLQCKPNASKNCSKWNTM